MAGVTQLRLRFNWHLNRVFAPVRVDDRNILTCSSMCTSHFPKNTVKATMKRRDRGRTAAATEDVRGGKNPIINRFLRHPPAFPRSHPTGLRLTPSVPLTNETSRVDADKSADLSFERTRARTGPAARPRVREFLASRLSLKIGVYGTCNQLL